MKIPYYKLTPSIKVDILAAGHHGRTALFHEDELVMEFQENVIPVAEKSRLKENVERDGVVYDALILTEYTYLVGYGYIEDHIDPHEVVKEIDEENVIKVPVDEEQQTATIVLFFEEKMSRH